MNLDKERRKAYRIVLFGWFGIVLSLLVLIGMAEFFIINHFKGAFLSISDKIIFARLIFVAIGLLELYFIFYIRKYYVMGNGDVGQKNRSFIDRLPLFLDLKEKSLPDRLRVLNFFLFACCEAYGAWGLLLFIIGRNRLDLYGFIGVAMVLMIINFPRKEMWVKQLSS